MVLTEIRERSLTQLAKDIVAEKVFTSNHISESDINVIPMVFLAISFIDPETTTLPEDISMLYEYYSQAIGSRAINGYPCFGSFRYLVKEEYDFVLAKCKEIQEVLDSI